MITSTLSKGDKPTKEQLEMIEKAKEMPITFDEDSPELTDEMEKAFRSAVRMRNIARGTV